MARRATFIDQARQEADNLLLLDAGDAIWSDRPLTVQSEHRLAVEMMNVLGYDAAVLGARDLQLGLPLLRQRLDEANFPALSANVLVSATGELFTTPYVVREIDGHRIGILGLTDAPLDPNLAPGFWVANPLEAAQQALDELAQQADVIILLSHAGPAVDSRLATDRPQIDLIVAGNHRRAPAYPQANAGRAPLLVAERPTVGHAGRFIGRADLLFDSGGQLQDVTWQVTPLDPNWADDPGMQALVARYAAGAK